MRLSFFTAFVGILSLPILALPQGPYSNTTMQLRGIGGWSQVTYPEGSIKSSIPIRGDDLELFALAKDGIDRSKLKRIVFVIHGKGRDPWNYYSHMTTALHDAHEAGMVDHIDEIGIWAPGFWNHQDEGVWPHSEMQARMAPSKKQLVWYSDSWTHGSESVYPANKDQVSSFTAIDDAIRYFGNKHIFPNVETIVLAGHSAGGQTLHRYAQLGRSLDVDAEIHYYIANPASYMYLDDRRPERGVGGAMSRAHCRGYNNYKYGLNKIDSRLAYNSPHSGSEAIFETYRKRHVHYQLGTADHASDTTRCSALVQGDSHYNRGRIYQAYLEELGYPERHTVDYIADVGHDDLEMFKSKHGMYRLFVENHAKGRTMPSSEDRTHGLDVTFTAKSAKAERHMPGLVSLLRRDDSSR